MKSTCATCLDGIIQAAATPFALVTDGVVALTNARFAELVGLPCEKVIGSPPGSLLPGLGLEGIVPEVVRQNRPLTIERTISFAGRQTPVWARAVPVKMAAREAALLMVVDTSALHQGQVALLRQMRKARTDNIWIFDEDLRVVYAELEPELQALRERPDFDPHALLPPGQGDEVRQILAAAKKEPGKQHSVTLRSQRESGRLLTVYADIIYYADTLSGYYLCCTRTRELRGSGIVTRLKEAYGVYTDVELAKLLQTSPAMLSRARHGRKPPGDWIIKAWEDRSVSADWLLTGRGSKF